MRRKKIVIKGVSMASDEEDWNRNKRDYNLMDIQREAKVAKGAQWMDGWMPMPKRKSPKVHNGRMPMN